jgi:hypothetical protein
VYCSTEHRPAAVVWAGGYQPGRDARSLELVHCRLALPNTPDNACAALFSKPRAERRQFRV